MLFTTLPLNQKRSIMKTAEVRVKKIGTSYNVVVSVPKKTSLRVTNNLIEALKKKILPRGCLACLSGINYIIHEKFERDLVVDLDKMIIK